MSELVIGVAGLVLTAVGLFLKVKRSRKETPEHEHASLILSDTVKRTLKLMQSDPTNEGVFVVVRTLGPAAPRLVCLNHTEIDTETNQRVLGELEAKGLVTISMNSRGDDKVTLTPLGWDLNPETGKVDRVGLTTRELAPN